MELNLGVIGTTGNRILIPAKASLELKDEDYATIESKLAGLVKSGEVVIVVEPKKSEEVKAAEKAAAIASAKALLAEVDKDIKDKPAVKKAPAKKEA
jgi:hypothetical protein